MDEGGGSVLGKKWVMGDKEVRGKVVRGKVGEGKGVGCRPSRGRGPARKHSSPFIPPPPHTHTHAAGPMQTDAPQRTVIHTADHAHKPETRGRTAIAGAVC